MPRNDELWMADEKRRKEARVKLNLPEEKKVILYAPTWRDSVDGGKTYLIKPPVHFDVWEKMLGKDHIILFRAHHQTTKVMGIEFNDFIRDVSDYPEVNELMIASDLLITDYSAIAFDYSILTRPILCFAYDYDTYLAERGTYFDMDEVYPMKSVRTEEGLLDRVRSLDYEKECEKVRDFRDRFVQYKGNAAEMCVRKLFGRN